MRQKSKVYYEKGKKCVQSSRTIDVGSFQLFKTCCILTMLCTRTNEILSIFEQWPIQSYPKVTIKESDTFVFHENHLELSWTCS